MLLRGPNEAANHGCPMCMLLPIPVARRAFLPQTFSRSAFTDLRNLQSTHENLGLGGFLGFRFEPLIPIPSNGGINP